MSRNSQDGSIIPVVILNWNGEKDTIECLRSIRASEPAGFVPVLVDNGSALASVEHLKQECRRMYGRVLLLEERVLRDSEGHVSGQLKASLRGDTLVFVQNHENLGFAKGNNVGLLLANLIGAEWVMLLNNDTVVGPDAFRELRAFLETEPSFAALTPQIRHFAPSSRIQNCGGRLTYLGSRSYNYANQDAAALAMSRFSVISFVTGCALLFRHRVTGPLTEDFFFGEEDYEFSLRLKARGLRMACVHGAVVQHKGGSTIRRTSTRPGAILVHYTNRLADVRNYYSPVRWHLTRAAAYAYLPFLLFRNGINPRKSVGMIRRIESHLKNHRGLDRAEFQDMIIST